MSRADVDQYPCSHPRTDENTKVKTGGRNHRKIRRCKTCYNAMRLASWHRNNPPKPKPPEIWEVEIKIRRNGKLHRRETALGPDAHAALENATNVLFRELQEGWKHES